MSVDESYIQLSKELLQQWRGAKSRSEFSSELGYSSSVYSSWERGRAWPTASIALKIAEYAGFPVLNLGVLVSADWTERVPMLSREGIALFLDGLIGDEPLQAIARGSCFSRHALSRYLNARAEPSLPAFLALLGVANRLFQALPMFSKPKLLPCISETWGKYSAQAALLAQNPLTSEILLALSLNGYQALPAHQPGWVARVLGVSLAEELCVLELLCDAGLLVLRDSRYVSQPRNIDLKFPLESDLSSLHRHWMQRRVYSGESQVRHITTMTLTRSDARRIEHLLREASERMRRIAAESVSAEEMHVVIVSMTRLDDTDLDE